MPLRRRLVLLAAGTVGVTVVLASIVCYLVMRDNLRDEVDASLVRATDRAFDERGLGLPPGGTRIDPPHGGPHRPPPPPGEQDAPVQLVRPDGAVMAPPEVEPFPVTDLDRRIARRRGRGVGNTFTDREVDGVHARVLTAGVPGGALVVGRSLESVDRTLSRLRLVLLLLCAGGTLFALALSRLFAERVIAPVTSLTETAEHISATEDLGRRIDLSGAGDDEVGRMASRFNAMLDRLQGSRDALAASVAAQRQLVADASHELRTPVTSLRTNVEVLLDPESSSLGADERRRLLEDMRAQSEELTLLINDVIELARGDQPLTSVDDVRLDEIAGEAVARAQRDAPGVRFSATLDTVVVRGDAERLGRAIGNLLDNAAKHSPPGGVVDVVVRDGAVSVRDHGPGVPDADKPLIFDRFYRGATSRGRPGSGLGLAIVRQVARTHGGDVTVEDAPGGGALFRLTLPAD
ncbi:MAG TPA: HAMP domain-containing sensor histidine kinase [Solirubrobacteraceae bacterium]|jgi:two-component system sensor histidine kinase MprB